MMRLPLIVAALLSFVSPAAAQSYSTEAMALENGVVLGQPISPEAFLLEADGKIRHLQSGGLCPKDFSKLAFIRTIMFAAPAVGLDVACDYGRSAPDGAMLSKLTIYFVKASESTTLDGIFEQYKKEILQAFRGGKEVPGQVKLIDPATKEQRTNYRAAGYIVSPGENPTRTELIVGIYSGWILKVRATYIVINNISRENAGTPENAAEMMRTYIQDLSSPYLGFESVMKSLLPPTAP